MFGFYLLIVTLVCSVAAFSFAKSARSAKRPHRSTADLRGLQVSLIVHKVFLWLLLLFIATIAAGYILSL